MDIHLIFDGPLSRDVPSLIAIEDAEGRSVTVGHWRQRKDGYWELVIRSAEPFTVIENGDAAPVLSTKRH
jgi:hypothetical protein